MTDVPKHQGERAERSIKIDAPVERVWECWANPDGIAGWFVDYARSRAETGGSVTWGWDGFGEFDQQVLVADPEKRLVLQAWPGVLLEVILERAGGSTVLTVVNSGFSDAAEWEDAIRGVASGWELAIAVLKEYAERYYGEKRRAFMHVRRSPVSPLEVKPWFGEASKLAQWFAQAGAPGRVGEPFLLALHDGETIHARTIASSEQEVAFALDEEPVVIELKAFAGSAMGPGPSMIGVRALTWGEPSARFLRLKESSAAALDRLGAQLNSVASVQ